MEEELEVIEETEIIEDQEENLSENLDEEKNEVSVYTEPDEKIETGEIDENNSILTSEEYQITIIDYTEHFETITEQIEYLTTTNEQLLANNMFFGSLFVSFGVCFILYKFIKIFL